MEKKILVPNSVPTQPGLENSKKNSKKIEKIKKTFFRHYFLPKRDEIGREREKKNLLPNYVQTRLGQENSEKNCKKMEKLKKPLSDINFSQYGMR